MKEETGSELPSPPSTSSSASSSSVKSAVTPRMRARKLSRIILVMHLVAAVLMLIEMTVVASMPVGTGVPQTIGFPSVNRTGVIGTPTVKALPDAQNPTAMVAIFLALAALDHMITSGIMIVKPKLAQSFLFEKEANPLRWTEYSVSASIMTVAIGALTGIYDIHMQFLMGTMTGLCMLLGMAVELLPKDLKAMAWFLFILASVACFWPWLIMWAYFSSANGIAGLFWFFLPPHPLSTDNRTQRSFTCLLQRLLRSCHSL